MYDNKTNEGSPVWRERTEYALFAILMVGLAMFGLGSYQWISGEGSFLLYFGLWMAVVAVVGSLLLRAFSILSVR